MSTNTTTETRGTQEQGFALVTIFTLMIPLLVAVVAFIATMNSRSNELRLEYDLELALLAAESGVDDAIYQGRTGNLVDGKVYTRDLGSGQSFTVQPTYLKDDGTDNDADGFIDEDDEDVFQVVVTGTYRRTTRRVAAYLGPVPLLPKLQAAMTTQDPGIEIVLKGTPLVSGNNLNIDGGDGSGADMPGLAIVPPGTVAHLLSELGPVEQDNVVGAGGPPSLATASSVDIVTLVAQIQNAANLILTTNMYSEYRFGDASLGTANTTFRNGDVTFTGNVRGAGVLVVTGDLEMRGNFRFDGVIIVLGRIINGAGTAQIYGSVLQGPKGGKLEAKGTLDIHYSAEAVDLATKVSGLYVAFNGWQELAN
ncbi:MAG: bactofilin family protein [Planctomycetota bacterium]|jgi:hypothetical protein